MGDRLIIGEFDGFVKSEKAAEEGKLAKAQFDERQRELRLSLLDNCKIVRLCWDDLRDPTKLDRKLKVAGVPRACWGSCRAFGCTSVENRTDERGNLDAC